MIAALYVETDGAYYGIDGVDPWDTERDARNYAGPHPVVAHPPCSLWVNLAAVNWKRYQRQRPAWYPGGDDGGCFAHALDSVRRFGGVLEHPASTHAWGAHGIARPVKGRWMQYRTGEWVCEVWQSIYGHRARKRTWLLYVGDNRPTQMNWTRKPGTHQIGGGINTGNNQRPKIGKKEASATPPAFRDALIALARGSR